MSHKPTTSGARTVSRMARRKILHETRLTSEVDRGQLFFSVAAMQRFLILLLLTLWPPWLCSAEQLIPSAVGTTWVYQMVEEAGPQFSFRSAASDFDQKIHGPAVYRIGGTQDLSARTLLKFEMHREGAITNTDLMIVNEHGIFCAARIDQFGKVTALDPPQTIIATPLEPGATWQFTTRLGGSNVHQDFQVLGAEVVDVPAGRFSTFHIHGKQTEPVAITIDRWFVPGTGTVKDVTVTKTAEGDLMRRVSLELKDGPRIMPRPEVKRLTPPKKISLTLGVTPRGQASERFAAATPKIYARWRGTDLPPEAKIRVVWVAENVEGVAPPDFVVDEASTTATAPDAYGSFTLARPDQEWIPGDYRVDIYVGAELIDSARLKIIPE